jgi:hypothetical protein
MTAEYSHLVGAMSGCLNFLQSLTDSQRRYAIGRLVQSRFNDTGNPLTEDMLKHPGVVKLNHSLGFEAAWRSEKDAIEPIEIGSPRFLDGPWIARVLFRYENATHSRKETVSNLEYQLVVNALVSIDDDGKPMEV